MKKLLLLTTLFSCTHSIELPEYCQGEGANAPSCVASTNNKKTTPKEANTADGRFVVHEWGTFTTLVNEAGETFTWYPLQSGAPLPKFVYAQWFQTLSGDWHYGKGGDGSFHGEHKAIKGTVRMETPVIYFYSDKERDLSLEIKFNNGYITEWYPHAAVPIKNPNVIQWNNIHLSPGAQEKYPSEPEGSEYYAARETDATPLVSKVPGMSAAAKPLIRAFNVETMLHSEAYPRNNESETQLEKFLFYRGVGSFDVPVGASIVKTDDKEMTVLLRNKDSHAIPGAILFYRDGDRVWSRRIDAMEVNESRPATLVLGAPSGVEAVKDDLVSLLVEQDLYGREATAMVKTWEEAWFEEGLRVFYIVPEKTTEAILPLTMSETPDEVERVLVGRIDIVTPALRQEINAATKEYVDYRATISGDFMALVGSNQELAQRVHNLASLGRFVLPLLQERQDELKEIFRQRPQPADLKDEMQEHSALFEMTKSPQYLMEIMNRIWPDLK